MNTPKRLVTALAALALTPALAHAASLIHRYNFNDGTANDSVGTANGTLVGAPTITGGSVILNGSTQWVNIAPVGADVGSATSVSFDAWVNWSGAGLKWQTIGDFSNNNSNAWFAFGPSSDLAGGAHPTPGGVYIDSVQSTPGTATPLPSGVQEYVAVTMDSVNHLETLYINGALAASGLFTGTFSSLVGGTTAHNSIGGPDEFGDPTFNGSINQFSIYTGVLSPTDIASNFAAGPVVATPEPASLALLAIGAFSLLAPKRRKH